MSHGFLVRQPARPATMGALLRTEARESRPIEASRILLFGASALCACATVSAGPSATPGPVRTQVMGEAVARIPLYSKVSELDLPESAPVTALTADGVVVRAVDPLVTYRLAPVDLVAGEQAVAVADGSAFVEPIVRSTVRLVLGAFRLEELDSRHLRQAEALIAEIASEHLRPHHIVLEDVHLRGLVAELPTFNHVAIEAPAEPPWMQRAALQQEVAAAQARMLNQEALGVATSFQLLAPSLTESALEDIESRSWGTLLTSRDTPVRVLEDSVSLSVELP